MDSLIVTSDLPVWVPLPGPQRMALESPADILFYGGAAGGGKSDLLIGAAMTQHDRSIIFRREGTQLKGLLDRMTEIIGSRDGYNGNDKAWAYDGRQIEFGACPYLGDESKYQGRPHDLKCFDEIPLFLEAQFRFLCGWLRSAKKGQRRRIICAGNPPTDSDGEWVIRYWAPWLDKDHPNPAKPGELRWFTTIDGEDKEVGPEPFYHNGKLVTPLSRTFIPSKIADNPYLIETGYEAQLQSLPEPLRSQMLDGSFTAGLGGDPFQVIPTEWVEMSQAKWTEDGHRGQEMDSLGADIARGGRDKTVIARRHGRWFDKALSYPGSDTPNGPVTAALIVAALRHGAPAHVDVIGVGGSVYDHLDGANIHVVAVNNSKGSDEMDRSLQLKFYNKRAELLWKMREALDPDYANENIILPPDPELKADLCCARWKLTSRGIQVESKDEIKARIGRSPDKGDAYVLANIATLKRDVMVVSRIKSKRAIR